MFSIKHMHGSRKFCPIESKFDNIFIFVVEGIEDPNTSINGPSLIRHQNAILMAFC